MVLSYLTFVMVGSYFVRKAGNLVGDQKKIRKYIILFIVLMFVIICALAISFFILGE